MRKPLILLIALVGLIIGFAQINTNYHYWFDSDYANGGDGQLTADSLSLELDVSQLSVGLHSFHVLLVINDTLTSAHSCLFFKAGDLTQYGNSLTLMAYMDGKPFGESKTLSSVTETQTIDYDIDVSSLSVGLHTFSVCGQISDGSLISAQTKIFLRALSAPDYSNTKCIYVFDNDFTHYTEAAITTPGVYDFDIDVSALDNAEHTLTYAMVLPDGSISSMSSITFTKQEVMPFTAPFPKVEVLDIKTSLATGIELIWEEVLMDIVYEMAAAQGYSTDQVFKHLGYNVYRKDAQGQFTEKVNSDTIRTTTYSIPSADLTEENTYVVEAIYTTGNSDLSDPVTAVRQVKKPTIAYLNKEIEIKCETPNAKINYQVSATPLDNPDPVKNGILYTGKFTQTTSGAIYAVAYLDGCFDSEAVSYAYDMATYTCEKPQITIDGNKVKLESATSNASIYYTLDGSEPNENSQLYNEIFELSINCTVKAIAVKEGYFNSPVASAVYSGYQVAKPAISLKGYRMSIACLTNGTEIRYTLDGTKPSQSSTLYTDTLSLDNKDVLIQAIATKTGYNSSPIDSIYFKAADVTCPVPVISINDEAIVTLKADNCHIYYTLNGQTPTTADILYDKPFKLKGNCTVKALAIRENYFNSQVVSQEYKGYKVATPTITLTGFHAEISCETDSAVVLYSKNGQDYTEGNSVNLLATDTKLYAKAMRAGYQDSQVAIQNFVAANATCSVPTFNVNKQDSILTISSSPQGATIHYTLTMKDNPENVVNGEVLSGAPIKLTYNGTFKAYATAPNYFQSNNATRTEDWLTCADPEFSFDKNTNELTITTKTPNCVIFYGIGNTLTFDIYAEPIKLTNNSEVVAFAHRAGWNDSESVAYDPTFAKTENVTIEYNGRYVTMNQIHDTEIYYTLNGQDPTKNDKLYEGPFDVEGIATLKARRFKTDFKESDVASYHTAAYFDGQTVTVDEAGHLYVGFDWCRQADSEIKLEDIKSLTIKGKLNLYDALQIAGRDLAENNIDPAMLAGLKLLLGIDIYNDPRIQEAVFPALEHLDMEGVVFQGSDIYFGCSTLVSVVLPASTPQTVKLSGLYCPSLAAVTWTSQTTAIPNGLFRNDKFYNPNLLLYVSSADLAPSDVRNVVVDGKAQTITLDDNGNFYCPTEFYADKVTYTHNYSMMTPIDGSTRGWETLALPFTVDRIVHKGSENMPAKGEIKSFEALRNSFTSYDECKPFWLYALGNAWSPAAKIEAYVPYIISMPNNQAYIDDYLLSGEVEFSAEGVFIAETRECISGNSRYQLIGTTLTLEKGEDKAPINLEPEAGTPEGSAFIPNLREVHPFEAYLAEEGKALKSPLRVADLGAFGTDVLPETLMPDDLWHVYSYNGILHISTNAAQKVTIYTPDGRAIRVIDLKPGRNDVTDLATGIYIVKDSKVFVE